MSAHRIRVGSAAAAALALLATAVPAVASTPSAPSTSSTSSTSSTEVRLGPGVTYRTLALTASHGPVAGYLVTVDLTDPRVGVDLLHPPTVSSRLPVSAMADARHAVAGINGDFFNISEEHPGITPTDSSDGPEIAAGRTLKAAVPDGQRFGPALPAGTSTRDVLGVGLDRRARLATLELRGSVWTPHGRLEVAGVNQYAVRDNGIAAFTAAWGSTARARVACGSDQRRADPCRTDVAEVAVRHGRVAARADRIGAGPIAPDTVVLAGRDRGADALRRLRVGEPALVDYRLRSTTAVPFAFAVGGYPILRGGRPLPGLDPVTSAPRTAAGFSADGRWLYLLTLDGRAELSGGLTVAELADQLHAVGASSAVNLDGGGSSTMVTRAPGADRVTIDNRPSDGSERPVANGIGVFTRS